MLYYDLKTIFSETIFSETTDKGQRYSIAFKFLNELVMLDKNDDNLSRLKYIKYRLLISSWLDIKKLNLTIYELIIILTMGKPDAILCNKKLQLQYKSLYCYYKKYKNDARVPEPACTSFINDFIYFLLEFVRIIQDKCIINKITVLLKVLD